MKIFLKMAIVFGLTTVSSLGFGAQKTYQVTGPVLEMNESSYTVQKGSEKWVISKEAGTKVTGDVKVGSKVTIEYTMAATTVTAKEEKASKKK